MKHASHPTPPRVRRFRGASLSRRVLSDARKIQSSPRYPAPSRGTLAESRNPRKQAQFTLVPHAHTPPPPANLAPPHVRTRQRSSRVSHVAPTCLQRLTGSRRPSNLPLATPKTISRRERKSLPLLRPAALRGQSQARPALVPLRRWMEMMRLGWRTLQR